MPPRFPLLRVLLLSLSACSTAPVAAPLAADVQTNFQAHYPHTIAHGRYVVKDGKRLTYWGLSGGLIDPRPLLPFEFAEIRRVSADVFLARRHGEERFTRFRAAMPPPAQWSHLSCPITAMNDEGPTPYHAIVTYPGIADSLLANPPEQFVGVILPDGKAAASVPWAPGTAVELLDEKGRPGTRIPDVAEMPARLPRDRVLGESSLLVLLSSEGRRWQVMDGTGNPVGEPLRRSPLDRLVASATIDGRSLEQWSMPGKAEHRHRLHQLTDGKTGEVLREWYSVTDGFVQGAEYVHLVPGIGVLVLDAHETERCYSRYGGLSDEAVEKLREELRVEAFYARFGEWNKDQAIDRFRNLLADHRRSPAPATTLPQWRTFDLASKQLGATDTVWVEPVAGSAATVAFVILRRLPDEPAGATSIGRLDAEMVSPTGDLIGHYEHVRFPTVRTGTFHVVTTFRPDHTLDEHILGPGLQYLATAPRPMTRVNNRHLAIPAPGTAAEDDLWVFLQPNAQFGAPPGVVGFRPVWNGWQQKAPWPGKAAYFLVRYAADAAHAWGRASADLATMTGPIWDAAELHLPPTVSRPFAFEGITYGERFAGRKVSSDDNATVEDNAVLVVRIGESWSAGTAVADAPNEASLHAEGKTMQEALERTFALAETYFASRQELVKAAHPALVAEAAKAQAERDEAEASSLRFHIATLEDAQRFYSAAPEAMAQAQARIDRARARLHVIAPEPVVAALTEAQRVAALGNRFTTLAMWNERVPNATAEQWYAVASSSFDLDLLEQATFFFKVTDPGKRSKLLAHWCDVVCQGESEQALQRAMERLLYAGQSFSADERNAVTGALRARQNSVRTSDRLRLEAGKAAERDANSAQRWAEQRSWPGVSGSASPVQTNWAMNDYKRGLDRQIAGKAWTPYGY